MDEISEKLNRNIFELLDKHNIESSKIFKQLKRNSKKSIELVESQLVELNNITKDNIIDTFNEILIQLVK